MIGTGIDVRVKIQDIVASQLPEFIQSDEPLTDDFLRQFYVSQESMGGAMDFASNLDKYLDVTALTRQPKFNLTQDVSETDTEIFVNSTDTFPNMWGLLKIDDEIITYTGVTTNSFTGAVRGFSGITSYHAPNAPGEVVFETTEASAHVTDAPVQNLSTLFLKEFYNKIKYTFTPGFESLDSSIDINRGNWIRQARSFYASKGSTESFEILFKVLYGEKPVVIDLEEQQIKPSTANYIKYDYAVCLPVSGDPKQLEGKNVFQSTDNNITASITRVENFIRGGTNYLRVNYYVSKDEEGNEKKLFKLSARTRVQRPWISGKPTVTVDSTIGFPDSGEIVSSNGDRFTYQSKTVNQFLDVTTSTTLPTLTNGDELFEDLYIVGYDKDGYEIKIRSTGVISGFAFDEDESGVDVGETIDAKTVGENITNTTFSGEDLSYKQIVANSFIYNTAVRMQVKEFSGASFQINSRYLDKSFIKIGDSVDILSRGSNNIIASDKLVTDVDYEGAIIVVDDTSGLVDGSLLDLRRNQIYATSSDTDIVYGNGNLLSNVLNVYDATGFNDHLYVSTNSLPSYNIETKLIENIISNIVPANFQSVDALPTSNEYSAVVLNDDCQFLTGDFITYSVADGAESICSPGKYLVEVLSTRKIRLYRSQSLVGSSSFVPLVPNSVSGDHIFTLDDQSDRKINPNDSLVKIPVPESVPVYNAVRNPYDTRSSEIIGTLTNGVNIRSFKSTDKVFYGPLTEVKTIFGGSGFNVINPPQILIGDGNGGDTASVYPAMKGVLQSVLVDPQEFEISRVTSISITGGNSSGAVLEPIIEDSFRTLTFDTRPIEDGGGIGVFDNTISFLQPHNLSDGEFITYNSFGRKEVGTGAGTNLTNGTIYFVSIVNSITIKLYDTKDDALAGINAINFDASNQGIGIQAFETKVSKQLIAVDIIDDGGFFYNREIIIGQEHVDRPNNSIKYPNHGFKSGERIIYSVSSGGVDLSPLVSGEEYYVGYIDDNTFQLYEISTPTPDLNLTKLSYVQFINNSDASSTHRFAYPEIVVTVVADFEDSTGREIVTTPIIRGSIENVYLTNHGLYGDSLLNFNKEPTYTVVSGSEAAARPTIAAGRLLNATMLSLGKDYSPNPVVNLEDPSGRGSGAILRAVVENGRVIEIIVINRGFDYSNESKVVITDRIDNAILRPFIRELTPDSNYRFGYDSISNGNYSIISYGKNLQNIVYNEFNREHSPLIGWARDGNPIYGPYAYEDPENINSAIVAMRSSYKQNSQLIDERPSIAQYPIGFFVDDYVYDAEFGDLDQYNGRYARTPDFPNGVYAYYATIVNSNGEGEGTPVFPYFIGPVMRDTPPVSTNIITADNFIGKPIYRNIFPYAAGNDFIGSEYLVQPYLTEPQNIFVTDVSTGYVSDITVVGAGSSYRVGDVAIFDSTEDIVNAKVSTLRGRDIVNVFSDYLEYTQVNTRVIRFDSNTVRVYVDPFHEYGVGEIIDFQNVPENLTGLVDASIKIEDINTSAIVINQEIVPGPNQEVIDIKIIRTIGSIAVNDILHVGSDLFKVLELFPIQGVVRVVRETASSTTYIVGQQIDVKSTWFSVPDISSEVKSELDLTRYTNPSVTFGFGIEVGDSVASTYVVGGATKQISIETHNIFIPEHNFRQNELVTINREVGDASIDAIDLDGLSYAIPAGLTSQFYVEVFSKDYIGLKIDIDSDPLLFILPTNIESINSNLYSITTNRLNQSVLVNRSNAVVVTETPHELLTNDIISAKLLNESQQVIVVDTNEVREQLIINGQIALPTDVDISTNRITIADHNFTSGDVIMYTASDELSSIGGIQNFDSYFIIKYNDDSFYLASSLNDTKPGNIIPIELTSVGSGDQTFSLVNPKINWASNGSLVFDLSSPNLIGKDVVFFNDATLTDIFVSNGIDSEFAISSDGVPGSVGATKTLTYSTNNRETIYYALVSVATDELFAIDFRVPGNNSIGHIPSVYTTQERVIVDSPTTFTYPLRSKPKITAFSGAENFKYVTSSQNTSGPIDKVSLISSGVNFTSIPEFIEVESEFGLNSSLRAQASNIGSIQAIDIRNPGWGYLSDSTIAPRGSTQPEVEYNGADIVSEINIIFGGAGYQTTPDAVLVDSVSRKVITNGNINFVRSNDTISEVEIINTPKGLDEVTHELFAVNNTNGIPINDINVNNTSNIVEINLQTPIAGYSVLPFNTGDKVYIEGIIAVDGQETNLNSDQIGYQFMDVIGILDTNPFKIFVQYPSDLDLSNARPEQFQIAVAINKKKYPVFEVVQDTAVLSVGEQLSIIRNGALEETDLIVEFSDSNSFKVSGNFYLRPGDQLKGSISGVLVTVSTINSFDCTFELNTTSRIDGGWVDNIGFVNEDTQALPDNDYYQNLSYSVKSSVTFDEMIGPVNKLVHPKGLKNFADTRLDGGGSIAIGGTSSDSITIDIIGVNESNQEPLRVDRINIFDLGYDAEINDNRTNRIRINADINRRRLTDYVLLKTNRVLLMDDIAPLFRNFRFVTFEDSNIKIKTLDGANSNFVRGLIQVRNPENDEVQMQELVSLFQGNNTFNQTKSLLTTEVGNDGYGIVETLNEPTEDNTYTLTYTPSKKYYESFDASLKIMLTENIQIADNNDAFIGYARLFARDVVVNPGESVTIFTTKTSSTGAFLYSTIEDDNGNLEYVECYGIAYGGNSYSSQYGFTATETSEFSEVLNTQYSTIRLSGNRVGFVYTNSKSIPVTVKTKVTELSSNPIGNQTYSFKPDDIPAGAERSINLMSTYQSEASNVASVDVITLDVLDIQSVRTLIQIRSNSFGSIQQTMNLNSDGRTFTNTYPFLTNGAGNAGVGTFGSVIQGSDFIIRFYPDPGLPAATMEVIGYHEVFFRESDFLNYNRNQILDYGIMSESYYLQDYFAPYDRFSFPVEYKNVPILEKKFSPTVTLDGNTFNINNHFFSDYEELYYYPGDSAEQPFSPIQTNVGDLPSTVYVIRIGGNSFELAATEQDAKDKIAFQITSAGQGNYHTIGMAKKIEKSIITLDGVLQSPIASRLLTYVTDEPLDEVDQFITLTGIGTMVGGDILKIDNEFVVIKNVGFGTSPDGPITNEGSFPLVEATRGALGSVAVAHSTASDANLFSGSYNLEGSNIFFTEAPRELPLIGLTDSNLRGENSDFQGRIFLQKEYDKNIIYDDVSTRFDGLTSQFPLTSVGSTIPEVLEGSGVVLINDIYQSPSTENNPDNDFSLEYNNVSGIGTLIFSGITGLDGEQVISTVDTNQNQLPRGGRIVTISSREGLGFAPLAAAVIDPILSGGSITGVAGTFGSGYNSIVPINVFEEGHSGTPAVIEGVPGAGGELSFNIINGGSGYNDPTITAPSPTYSRLPVKGIFRRDGTTDMGSNLFVTVNVSAARTTGVGRSEYFSIYEYSISEDTYGFQDGDILEVVGIVTDKNLSAPIEPFQLFIDSTQRDNFSAFNFGQLDFIDNIGRLQDGVRRRFPLQYKGDLVSFEKDPTDPESFLIDLDSILLIYINTVLQVPGESYTFSGGTSIIFSEPPTKDDEVDIYFYRGKAGLDDELITIYDTSLKPGDEVQLTKNNAIPTGVPGTKMQDVRDVNRIEQSDEISTNLYFGNNDLTEMYPRPLAWDKQKRDVFIYGEPVSKARGNLESVIRPTASIIRSFTDTSTTIFVDNVDIFEYEGQYDSIEFDIRKNDVQVDATFDIVLDPLDGSVTSITVTNPLENSGYSQGDDLILPPSPTGDRAGATLLISGGRITSVIINDGGSGYTSPPSYLIKSNRTSVERDSSAETYIGFSGKITEISALTGGSTGKRIRFFYETKGAPSTLASGYSVSVFNTVVGNGVRSIVTNNSQTVGVGTQFLDCVYSTILVSETSPTTGYFTTNVGAEVDISNINIIGSNLGQFSWGVVSNITRTDGAKVSASVDGTTYSATMDGYPALVRSNQGFRDSGGISDAL